MNKAPVFIQEADGIQEYRLENGLKILLVHNPAAPVVTVQVVYHVGSRNEAVGHTGATHFLEHMLFKGTPSFNKAKGTAIPQVLNRIGANFNATTWLDRTTYYETVPADQLALALQLEAERMQQAFIRERDRQMEMTVVRNEMERDENDPDSQMFKHLFAHAFLAHPYHHPTIGWHSDVEGMPTSRLRKFYKEFYHPNNATLLLVGDFERQAALQLVSAHFGSIPASPKPIAPMYTREFIQEGERRFVLRRPGQLGSLQMAWHVPPMAHRDSHALDVLQDILSEGVNSRLYQAVVETQLGLYAGAYNLQLRDPGLFIVHSKLSSGVSHADLEAALEACISEIQQNPPDERELQRVKNQVRAAFSYQRHGAHQLASMLAEFEAAASWQHMVHYLDRLEAVTVHDVQRVAQTYLKPDNRTVGHFIPQAANSVDISPVLEAEPLAAVPARQSKTPRRTSKGQIQRQTFGGGVLLTQENHLDNTVAIHGQLRAGVAYNPDHTRPLAQLTMGMLKKGTAQYTKLALADQLAQLGSTIDFRLGTDTVHFSLRCLSEHLESSLHLLREILLTPRFPAEELDKLKHQRMDRLRQRQDNTDAMAYDLLYRQLYPSGHYHHQPPVETLIAATEAVSLAEIESFYQQHYRNGGMVLAGVGALDSDSLHAFLESTFASWQPEALAWPEIPDQALQSQGQTLIHRMPDKANVSIVMGHQSHLKRTDKDYFAAMLGNHVLGQSSLSSRLGLRIRDQLGLTYGIYSHFPDLSRTAGPWVVAVTTHPDNVQAVIAETRKVIRQSISKGLTTTELSEARSSLIGSYLVNLTTHPEIASRLLQLEHYQLGLDYFQQRGQRIAAISDPAVAEALRTHLHPDRLSIAIAGQYESTGD